MNVKEADGHSRECVWQTSAQMENTQDLRSQTLVWEEKLCKINKKIQAFNDRMQAALIKMEEQFDQESRALNNS